MVNKLPFYKPQPEHNAMSNNIIEAEVPQEIIEAEQKIAQWAKENNIETFRNFVLADHHHKNLEEFKAAVREQFEEEVEKQVGPVNAKNEQLQAALEDQHQHQRKHIWSQALASALRSGADVKVSDSIGCADSALAAFDERFPLPEIEEENLAEEHSE